MNYDMHRKHEYFKFLACIGCTFPILFFLFFSNFRQSWGKKIGQVPKKCTKLPHLPLQYCPRFLILLTTLFWGRGRKFLLPRYIFSMSVIPCLSKNTGTLFFHKHNTYKCNDAKKLLNIKNILTTISISKY